MKPFVQLTGQDGNAFSIIGRVSGVIRKEDPDKAIEFAERAFDCATYDDLLRLIPEYCEVG